MHICVLESGHRRHKAALPLRFAKQNSRWYGGGLRFFLAASGSFNNKSCETALVNFFFSSDKWT